MPDPWPHLVQLLARLEDEAPYVTLPALSARWAELYPDAVDWLPAAIAEAVAEQRLFVDRRQQLDPQTGALRRVPLVRLNRRHPAVRAWLPAE
jgi:hypothetical protein